MAWASLLRLRAAVDTAAARVLSALGCGDERRRCSPLQRLQEGVRMRDYGCWRRTATPFRALAVGALRSTSVSIARCFASACLREQRGSGVKAPTEMIRIA